MSAKINYLSIEVRIGTQTFALETDDPQKEFYNLANLAKDNINTAEKKLEDVKTNMKKALDGGLTLKMEKGKVISVTIGELKNWVKDTFETDNDNLTKFLDTVVKSPGTAAPAASTIDSISIQLWNLSIGYSRDKDDNIKLSFTFYIKVTLYTGLLGAIFPGTDGNPNPITNIVDINSLGLGMTFSN